MVVANYESGDVTLVGLDSHGIPVPNAVAFLSHRSLFTPTFSAHGRQDGPHPHHAFYHDDSRRLVVTDLGLNSVVLYLEDPSLPAGFRFVSESRLHAEAGPRHCAPHPSNPQMLLTVNELDSTLSIIQFDDDRNRLQETCFVSTTDLPESAPKPFPFYDRSNHPAALVVSPSGNFALVSNRGADTISVFRIGEALEKVGEVSSGGAIPWTVCFEANPDSTASRCLVSVTNQYSRGSPPTSPGSVVLFEMDLESGKLTQLGSLAIELCMASIWL